VLPSVLPEDQSREISGSKAWLTGLLGQAPGGFAYPQGQISPSVVEKTRICFDYGLTTDRQIAPGLDLHQIRRFCPMREHDDLHRFAQALVLAPMEGG
jgi:peptidoglycan/xylan/chitin deacetylase (PgdA/CDA1 family)